MAVKTQIGKLLAIVVFSMVSGLGLLFLAHHSGPSLFLWIEIGASLGLIVTFYVGWWAKQKGRLLPALVLLLLGNLTAFTTILLPLGEDKSKLFDVAGLLYVLSFVVKLVSPWKLLRR